MELTTDSTATYSFRIETPTDSSSDFENFVIDIKEEQNLYFIAKYKYNNLNDDNIPFIVTVQFVSEEQVNIGDFQEYIVPEMDDGECYMLMFIQSPRDFSWGWEWVPIECGGNGSDSDYDNEGDNGMDGTTGDPDVNSGIDGDSNDTTDGGGSDSNNSNSTESENNSTEIAPVGINDPQENINCDLFYDLVNDQPMNELIELYKDNTSLSTEIGMVLTELPDGTYSGIAGVNQSNSYAVAFDIPNGTTVDYVIHTHNTGGLSVFSASDLKQLYNWITNPDITIDTDTFVNILVTENDVYAISFSNTTDFINLGNIWLNDPLVFSGFDAIFTNPISNNSFGINIANNTTNEINFLRLLQNYNSGILIHKANDDLTEWTNLSFNPITNTVVQKTCP